MRILVAFYSRTGNTRKVAGMIAKELKADLDDIADKTDRSGIRGWLMGGRDAFKRFETEIEIKKAPEKYDLVIVGTPIWAATQCPATLTYLKQHKLRKAAYFCTFGGSPGKCFPDMEALGGKPVATLGLKDKGIGTPESNEKVKEFCKRIASTAKKK